MRLEVTTDGRHLTFILVSLYEAGYGVQVVGSPWVFRELLGLRKSAPIPFVIGGKQRECGISISDREPSTLNSGPSTVIHLDYDYFSRLMERGEPRNSRIDTKSGKHGDAQGTCAGASETDSLTSKLAHAPVSESLIRSADDPALAYRAGELGSDGGNQPADSKEFLDGQSQAGLQMDKQKDHTIRPANDPTASGEYSSSVPIRDIRGKNAFSLDTGHSPLVTAPQAHALDARRSTLNSSPPATSHSPLATALRAPYFMHPSVYHRGLHKRWSPSTALDFAAKQRRRFRIGFFGTQDREFYTKHYHFPGMNRFEILEIFLKKFGDRMAQVSGAPDQWPDSEIVVSIDEKGGDRRGKTFLSQEHYFEALQECDFVLSPPGWCMPVSHNLIEAMFCGAIPITNSGAFMAQPLEVGRDCLGFSGEPDFVAAIEKALSISDQEIEQMRGAVWDYYGRFLEPMAFGGMIGEAGLDRVLVNAEEKSVTWVRDYQTGVGAFMAKFC